MSHFYFEDQVISTQAGDTVLDALLNNGVSIPYGCRAGACQCCLVDAYAGSIPEAAQAGLSPAQIGAGALLSCRCPADSGLLLRRSHQSRRQTLQLQGRSMLSEDVLQLRFASRQPWQGGQYLSLYAGDTARCFSIANSAQQDTELELHIRLRPGGSVSSALADLAIGDAVQASRALGDFRYRDEVQPMVLLGHGTALAPLLGVAREARARGHSERIDLLIASRSAENYYGCPLLTELADTQDIQARVLPCPQPASAPEPVLKPLLNTLKDLRQRQIFIAGAAPFIDACRRCLMLAGARPGQIVTETFVDFQR